MAYTLKRWDYWKWGHINQWQLPDGARVAVLKLYSWWSTSSTHKGRQYLSSSMNNQMWHLIQMPSKAMEAMATKVSCCTPGLLTPSVVTCVTPHSVLFFLSKFPTKAHECAVNLQAMMAFQNVGLRHLWVDLPWIWRLSERHISPTAKSPSQWRWPVAQGESIPSINR